MSTRTLLELVQDILNSMDSDEVNSINDTIESIQVANIVRTTYYNIIDGKDWPNLYQLSTLTGLGDTTKPTHMQIPENMIDVNWVVYNTITSTGTKDTYTKIKYKTPEEFVLMLNARDSSASNVTQVVDTIELNIINDKAPEYWTSFDNEYIVFDSYDSVVDNTMQSSKSQVYGKIHPSFTLSDSFVPDLPVQAFSYLLAEAKAVCFVELKQTQNPKAEQNAVTHRRRMSQQAWKTADGISFPDYGRKPK